MTTNSYTTPAVSRACRALTNYMSLDEACTASFDVFDNDMLGADTPNARAVRGIMIQLGMPVTIVGDVDKFEAYQAVIKALKFNA